MANLQGYGTNSVGNMLNHYTRHAGDPEQTKYRYANQDIDQTRTHLNYAIFARDDPAAFVQSKIDEVDVKPKGGDKATNVISDWVITLPKNPALIGREREFFQTAYDYMLKTVPEKLIVGAWVHMDENQPHMHFCFCPMVHTAVMTNDKSRPLLDAQGQVKRDKKGTPRYERVQVRDAAGKPVYRSSFGQTKVYTRARMKKFHPDLEKAMEGHFGFKVGIELEDKGEKLLSDLKQPDYIKAKETMSRQQSRIRALEAKEVETRGKLGALTDEVEKKRSQSADIDFEIGVKTGELDDLQDEVEQKIELRDEVGENLKREQRRLESVRRTAGRFEEDVEELEAIASLAERFDHAGRFEKRGTLDEIAARCDGLRGRVSQFVEEVREAVGRLGLAIADLTRRLGPRSARMTTKALKRDLAALERDYGEDDDRSPKARAAEAQRAARARDVNRDDRPPQRSWSQSR